MKISIVTPSFNQGHFIEETIRSVASQAQMNVEHIIVDNCSTDETLRLLKQYPSLKVIAGPDRGQSDALNKGFKAASGDIIGWLNADDRYLPGCLEAVSDFFKNHPDGDVFYGDYRLIDQEGKVLSARKELAFDLFMLKYLHVLCIPSTTTFFRRRIFEEGHFLSIDYHYAMDYEFCVRLALKGYKFLHVPVFLADFRVHTGSKSQRQTLLQKQEMEKALFEQDAFLKNMKTPWRKMARFLLMLAARSKRCGLKLMHRAYF